ncbi:branched-chain amino acid ABC transporter permease [Salsipaludibacter albus]|uniref:branched-chain amino acid ABC transporter permease n=1 Tax=Salsipaludibacter albus TaxID=2849650 RepID=UPI001EE479B0|nr:branched-chain amino acid ABC transporter permease [Salsipaludibacter albus]MBY5162703.1 branched-chain amino acid ABC transporter permease [Salsipaludibacter albus]
MDWEVIFRNAILAGISREAAVYAIAAVGLNVHFGYTGLLNFGQVGFMSISAYGVGISITQYGAPVWLAFIIGLLAAVFLALLLGVPTLRLRADYLAIVTIAASEIIRLTFRSVALTDWSGGSNGINGFADGFYVWNPFDPSVAYGFGSVKVFGNQAYIIIVGWTLAVLVTLLVWLLMRSPWGRVLKSIREDEDAARALGKNAYWYKMQSLILGGVLGGLAGIVLSVGQSTVQPDVYSPPVTFFIWTALILGGVGRIWSPIFGAVAFWMILSLANNVLDQATQAGIVPAAVTAGVRGGSIRFMIVGLGLMLLMAFRPQGVFGDRNEMMLADR